MDDRRTDRVPLTGSPRPARVPYDANAGGNDKTPDQIGGFRADVKTLCSNLAEAGPTPDFYTILATPGAREAGLSKAPRSNPSPLAKRFGVEQIADLTARAAAGVSASALAIELGVSTSALVRLLKTHGVELKRARVTELQRRQLVLEYEAGATVAELEAKHTMAHNTVLRALKTGGAKMRPRGRPGVHRGA